ncbi:hypothetical protein [Pampinifervens florentissimum]|uniref:hypothetical protein n=1 Tax=Pampinifervens florentissimum TaxID=1632019 RepID=UPI0020C1BF62|nr:hypothetical protein [Hydrogenobacter sp. T-8]
MPKLSRKVKDVRKKLRLKKKKEKQLIDFYQSRLIESLKELRIPLLLLHFPLA